jgi:hypothetical protein
MKSKETEPLFVPAAIFSSASVVVLLGGLCSRNRDVLAASVVLWGVGMGFWHENGRQGGRTPWPRSKKELLEMLHTFGKK